MNVFMLFVGFGLGSLAFGKLMELGFTTAFGLFATVELLVALLSFRMFRSETPSREIAQTHEVLRLSNVLITPEKADDPVLQTVGGTEHDLKSR